MAFSTENFEQFQRQLSPTPSTSSEAGPETQLRIAKEDALNLAARLSRLGCSLPVHFHRGQLVRITGEQLGDGLQEWKALLSELTDIYTPLERAMSGVTAVKLAPGNQKKLSKANDRRRVLKRKLQRFLGDDDTSGPEISPRQVFSHTRPNPNEGSDHSAVPMGEYCARSRRIKSNHATQNAHATQTPEQNVFLDQLEPEQKQLGHGKEMPAPSTSGNSPVSAVCRSRAKRHARKRSKSNGPLDCTSLPRLGIDKLGLDRTTSGKLRSFRLNPR